jgi:hypothetical protein
MEDAEIPKFNFLWNIRLRKRPQGPNGGFQAPGQGSAGKGRRAGFPHSKPYGRQTWGGGWGRDPAIGRWAVQTGSAVPPSPGTQPGGTPGTTGPLLRGPKARPAPPPGPPQPEPHLPCPRWRDSPAPGLTPSAGRSGVSTRGRRSPLPQSGPLLAPCPRGTGQRLPRTGSGSGSSWWRYRSRCWGPRLCRRPG